MEAKELRIGNWIDTTVGSPISLRIVSINNECVFISNEKDLNTVGLKCLHAYLKPILLTEEWLVKLGFEDWNDTGYIYHLNEVHLYYRGDSEYVYGGNDMNQNFETVLNYVHQLQNLYFALTGLELLLKN